MAVVLCTSDIALAAKEAPSSGCLAHLITAASISKSAASKYESGFAKFRLNLKAVKPLPSDSMKLLFGIPEGDAKKISSCFQRSSKSPAICKRLKSFECHGRGVCRTFTKSKPFYQCVCRSPFKGVLCERRPNYCKPRNPCANGGVCRSGNKGFTCRCRHGYSGPKCQDFWMSEAVFDKKMTSFFGRTDKQLKQQSKDLKAILRRAGPRKYKLITVKMTHAAAQKACLSKGMRLAIPRNKQENTLIGKLADKAKNSCWIGLNDKRKEGKWVDGLGRPLLYTNWYKSEPNDSGGREDCGMIYVAPYRYQWNDGQCGSTYPAVCESIPF